jgi:DNA (cytosine-5)-methyltransferase 1
MVSVVSTFSGCGGSSLGYRMAGGKVLLAVEWDENACATYRLNFPDTPLFSGDIANLSVEEVFSRISLTPGELDVLDGSRLARDFPPSEPGGCTTTVTNCSGSSSGSSRVCNPKRS